MCIRLWYALGWAAFCLFLSAFIIYMLLPSDTTPIQQNCIYISLILVWFCPIHLTYLTWDVGLQDILCRRRNDAAGGERTESTRPDAKSGSVQFTEMVFGPPAAPTQTEESPETGAAPSPKVEQPHGAEIFSVCERHIISSPSSSGYRQSSGCLPPSPRPSVLGKTTPTSSNAIDNCQPTSKSAVSHTVKIQTVVSTASFATCPFMPQTSSSDVSLKRRTDSLQINHNAVIFTDSRIDNDRNEEIQVGTTEGHIPNLVVASDTNPENYVYCFPQEGLYNEPRNRNADRGSKDKMDETVEDDEERDLLDLISASPCTSSSISENVRSTLNRLQEAVQHSEETRTQEVIVPNHDCNDGLDLTAVDDEVFLPDILNVTRRHNGRLRAASTPSVVSSAEPEVETSTEARRPVRVPCHSDTDSVLDRGHLTASRHTVRNILFRALTNHQGNGELERTSSTIDRDGQWSGPLLSHGSPGLRRLPGIADLQDLRNRASNLRGVPGLCPRFVTTPTCGHDGTRYRGGSPHREIQPSPLREIQPSPLQPPAYVVDPPSYSEVLHEIQAPEMRLRETFRDSNRQGRNATSSGRPASESAIPEDSPPPYSLFDPLALERTDCSAGETQNLTFHPMPTCPRPFEERIFRAHHISNFFPSNYFERRRRQTSQASGARITAPGHSSIARWGSVYCRRFYRSGLRPAVLNSSSNESDVPERQAIVLPRSNSHSSSSALPGMNTDVSSSPAANDVNLGENSLEPTVTSAPEGERAIPRCDRYRHAHIYRSAPSRLVYLTRLQSRGRRVFPRNIATAIDGPQSENSNAFPSSTDPELEQLHVDADVHTRSSEPSDIPLVEQADENIARDMENQESGQNNHSELSVSVLAQVARQENDEEAPTAITINNHVTLERRFAIHDLTESGSDIDTGCSNCCSCGNNGVHEDIDDQVMEESRKARISFRDINSTATASGFRSSVGRELCPETISPGHSSAVRSRKGKVVSRAPRSGARVISRTFTRGRHTRDFTYRPLSCCRYRRCSNRVLYRSSTNARSSGTQNGCLVFDILNTSLSSAAHSVAASSVGAAENVENGDSNENSNNENVNTDNETSSVGTHRADLGPLPLTPSLNAINSYSIDSDSDIDSSFTDYQLGNGGIKTLIFFNRNSNTISNCTDNNGSGSSGNSSISAVYPTTSSCNTTTDNGNSRPALAFNNNSSTSSNKGDKDVKKCDPTDIHLNDHLRDSNISDSIKVSSTSIKNSNIITSNKTTGTITEPQTLESDTDRLEIAKTNTTATNNKGKATPSTNAVIFLPDHQITHIPQNTNNRDTSSKQESTPSPTAHIPPKAYFPLPFLRKPRRNRTMSQEKLKEERLQYFGRCSQSADLASLDPKDDRPACDCGQCITCLSKL